jgi:hypothetical protein
MSTDKTKMIAYEKKRPSISEMSLIGGLLEIFKGRVCSYPFFEKNIKGCRWQFGALRGGVVLLD